MIIKEVSTKIINYMTPGLGVLMLGRGHMSYSENALSSTLSMELRCCFPVSLLVFFL